MIGIGEKTLRKYYADVLATAEVKASSIVAQSLFNKAVKGEGAAAVSAAIFWLKVRGGWRERDVHEITGPGGGPIQTMDLTALSDAQLAALEPVLRFMAERDRKLITQEASR